MRLHAEWLLRAYGEELARPTVQAPAQSPATQTLALIERLLAEKPDALGLSVPGMPRGSPGMESPVHDAYHVYLIGRDGRATIYASYR